MSGNQTRQRNRNNEAEDDQSWGNTLAVLGTGAALGLGALGLYWYKSSQSTNSAGSGQERQEPTSGTRQQSSQSNRPLYTKTTSSESDSGVVGYVSDLLQRVNVPSSSSSRNMDINHESSTSRRGVPRSSIPENPVLNNLNALLDDIYKRFVALNDEDFEHYYQVFTDVFKQIHGKMKEVDPYFGRYSSTVQLAGSHYDRLRIGKPDEFDVDIMIDLPLNLDPHPLNLQDSDIMLEPIDAGFLQLRVGVQYKRLPYRDGNDWQINKTAYEWKDDQDYLLRSAFMDWFKGVVDKALNTFPKNCNSDPLVYSNGIAYTVKKSESGPARTIFIENRTRNFKLDVDLVPALKLPESRWPITAAYRPIEQMTIAEKVWMVVPKPNKSSRNKQELSRSWRIALHVQERKLLHNSNHLRQAIRLVKKLRDAQGMTKIASYYIKTLALWEVSVLSEPEQRAFCNQNPATLFKILVKKLHEALVAKKIPYFWNKKNNLIGSVDEGILNGYVIKLQMLLDVLNEPLQFKHVARFLLTSAEFDLYNNNYLHI